LHFGEGVSLRLLFLFGLCEYGNLTFLAERLAGLIALSYGNGCESAV
jgi:hypothetical protein